MIHKIYHYFNRDYISINLERLPDNKTSIRISGDYNRSPRKSRLYFDAEILKKDTLTLWKSIKTPKLEKLCFYFGEIDWYDDLTDIYYTPVSIMQKGKKLPESFPSAHGSIPKDWSFNILMHFNDIKQKKVIFDVLDKILGFEFNDTVKKDFLKELKPFLGGKVNNIYFNLNED
jgi:hypothetical protein